MIIDILTLFPDMISGFLNESIIKRSINKGLVTINIHDFRKYSLRSNNQVDDTPYGGGAGMVIKPDVIYDAYRSIVDKLDYKPKLIYLTPQGKVFNQKIARELANEKHLILLCGHYEGIDQRVLDKVVDEEISIGDYVLTGGELPAMVLIDAISRNIDGVLDDESLVDESFNNDLLEYPQYTRPEVFMGEKVPEVLLSGHHANIEKWRREKSLEITKKKRPDLIK